MLNQNQLPVAVAVTQRLINAGRQRCCQRVESINLVAKGHDSLIRRTGDKLGGGFLQSAASSESNPIVHEVWMWRGLHQRDGVEDVPNVVAEVKDGVGDDGLGGGDAGRQQGQRGGQRQRRLQLFDRQLLQG